MNYIKLIAGFTILIFISCNVKENNEKEVKTGAVFFSDSANTLWRHKVNSIDDLQKYSKVFKGIEFDLVYYADKNKFKVEHDKGSKNGIMLMDYFASIPNPENNYYWIDIKNLKYEYIDDLLERLLFVLNKYGIKENVICESWSLQSLKKLNKAGIYTSYWIPDFPYNGKITDKQQKVLDKIVDVLNDCQHNAISVPYKMLPFIKDYLPNCTVHLWTNGLKTEEDKILIKEIANTECVKIVLIDYEEPF